METEKQNMIEREKRKERLYDSFGELLYAVAISDGFIQAEEAAKIAEMLKNHPWGSVILWSFNYESKKQNNPNDTYKKALMALKDHGPDEEYRFLIQLLEEVAKASGGIDEKEGQVIEGMQGSLKDHFLNHVKEQGLMR